MKNRTLVTVAAAGLFTIGGVHAQGVSEYGGLLGTQGKPMGGGLQNVLNQTYSGAARNFGSAGGGQGHVQSLGRPMPNIDPDDAERYAKQANTAYLEAQKLVKQGKSADAVKQLNFAITVRERIWGDGDPAIAQMLSQRADLHRKLGQSKDCENDYRKLLASNIRRFGPGAKELDKTLETLGDMCAQNGNEKDAVSFYKQLYAIRQRNAGPDSASLKDAKLKLAHSLTLSGNYGEAEPLLREAIAGEESSPKPDNAYLSKALNTYGALLRENGRDADATKLEDRARELSGVPATPAAAGEASASGSANTAMPVPQQK